ncbi:MAG TPA: MlaD family protein [Pseudobdellovibrionaceae bacterium]|nr:MlaD family protein [Pseudobdellovibrionaceae bacterium]
METSKTQNLKIGVFVTLGLFVIAMSIFMLGSNSNYFSSKVVLYAEFQQVQGLSVGSVVSLSGITVGNISEITFDSSKNQIQVEMSINQNFKTKIRKNSTLEVRTQGALGDKYIYIIPGPIESAHIESGDALTVAKSNDFMSVLANRANESEKIFDILNETYLLLKSVNKNNKIEHILENINETTLEMKNTTKKVTQLVDQTKFNNSIDKMDKILGKIDRGEGTLGALINDATLHNQIKKILGGQERQNHLKKVLRTSIEKVD